MKGKFRFFAISFAMVMALLGGMIIAQPAHKVYAADLDTRIDFTPVVSYTGNYKQTKNNDTFLLGGEAISNTTVTVAYNVVYSDAVNNLLLIPTYDHEVFSVHSVTPNNDTVLGTATVTGGDESSEALKILFDSADTFSLKEENAQPVTLFTIEFTLNAEAALQDNAVEYSFGLFVPAVDTVDYNDMSTAHVDLTEVHKGEQERVAINVINDEQNPENIVRVLRMLDAHIAIGYNSSENENNEKFYSFVYGASAPVVEEVEELNTIDPTTVEYTYDGTAETLNITWYRGMEYDSQLDQYVYVDELEYAPVNVGKYYVGISAPADGIYRAVPATYREVNIIPVQILVNIADKSSDYGDSIVALTHDYSGSVDLGISLSTTATSSSNVGNYPITGSWSDNNPNYSVSFTGGTYTINPKAITITAANQSAPYTGEEPVVDQTKYTVAGVNSVSGVVITKVEGVNVGSYTLTPSLNNSNYNVTAQTGVFTITSVGKNADYVKSFFSGDTVTYDAQNHDLLIVTNKPSWIGHSAVNNVQKDANTYQITVNIVVSAQDAKNYMDATLNEDQYFVATVNGEITPAALQITAADKTSAYGTTPVTLTPATVEGLGSDVINVGFTVKNGNEVIELTKTTPVGNYSIVPSATNTNYTYTYTNGTYSVTKANAAVTASANNVYYNRDLSYAVTANVNNVSLAGNCVITITNSNNVDVTNNAILDAGTYTVTATVVGTDNYFGATQTAQFTVSKVDLATPVVAYNYNTATWSVITADAGISGTGAKALVNGTTVSYSVAGASVTPDNGSCAYTATSAGTLVLTVSSDNANYNSVTVNLESVYSVLFGEGSHPHSDVTNMPATQYVFNGQTATAPASNPEANGYTFVEWRLNDSAFSFSTPITANTTLIAQWNANQYTITFKVSEDDENPTEIQVSYYGMISAVPADPEKQSDNPGITYTFEHWYSNNVAYEKIEDYLSRVDNEEPFIVTGPVTFVAQFTTNYNSFTVTYYLSVNGGQYEEYAEPTEVWYGEAIEYRELSTNVHWFTATKWYLDEDRTQAVPTVMPADDIDVYGAIVFNIGQGDVNGDGFVTADDITLYRRWIVGGYTMTFVANGDEWETAQEYDSSVNYFLSTVADNNQDQSRDIRDVSITRMAIVGGYTWDIENGKNVTGREIIRNVQTSAIGDIATAINSGKKVTLTSDITENEGILNIVTSKDIDIDLNGHTLTISSFSLVSTSYSTITVKNGTIVTTGGITISAPNGNVVLEDLTGYDENGLVNLAAANHSLHFNGNVEFYVGEPEEEVEPTPAAVKVEKGTHVVVEEAAKVIVEKIVVTENFVAPVNPVAEDLVITLDNYSVKTPEFEVEGRVVSNNEITSRDELVEAGKNGGSYTLMADLSYTGKSNRVYFYKDTVINLNGFNITSTNEIPLAVTGGATLTIEGNGIVNGVEGCVMAFGSSNIVINGGTYNCTDNFVFGTNGTAGKGGNTITINAGTFNGGITSAGYVACGVYVANDDIVTINGGTFNITNGVGVLARSGNTTIGSNVVFNVTGNGVAGKVGDSRVVIPSGEKLVLDLAGNYPGGEPTLTNNTSYGVCVIVENLADINAYKSTAETLFLGKDINCGNSDIVFTSDIKVNLGGKTITFTNWGFDVRNGATLTIGNGTVNAVEAALYAWKGATLIVNDGTYTSTNNFVIGTHGGSGNGNNTVIVNGGTFNGSMSATSRADGYVACGIYVANNDTVAVNAGTFNITNGVGILARSGSTTVANGVVLNVTGNGVAGKIGDSRVVLPSGEELVLDLAANYPGGEPTLTNNSSYNIYCVGGAVVADAEELVTALAANYNEIYLLADILPETAIALNKTVTIYGNGHKLKAIISGNGNVTLNNVWTTNISVAQNGGFTGTLIFNGGVLDTDSDGTDDADAAFYSRNNPSASFEFRNMTISANITKGIKIFNAAAVVIDNCEFDASKLTIMQGGSNSSIQSLSLVDIQLQNNGADITITNSTFTDAPQGSTSVPAFVSASGTLEDSDTGAAIKLKVEKGAEFGSVTITGNTFARNYRDILVGTAPYVNQLQSSATSASNGRSGDGLQYNTITGWAISGNTTDLGEKVASRGVATLSHTSTTIDNVKYDKYTTYVDNVGEIVGGAGIWTVNKVFEKIDGKWYYVENGSVYAVSVVSGKAVLTEYIRNINNLADLEAFRDEVNAGNNFAGKTIMLNADITLDGAWEPISNYLRKDSANESKWFAGTFDGNGHTISGLTNENLNANCIKENSSNEYVYGLFGSVKNAVIKNLTLTVNIVKIDGLKGDFVGALVGYYVSSEIKTNISNITVSGSIAGADNVGGLVGRATGTYFKASNITVSGTTITADKKASGIVGTGNAHEMVFENCTNNANISSTDPDSNQGYNTVAGISITWNGDPDSIVCRKVVMTNCANNGLLSSVNDNSLKGSLAVDYSPKTQLNENGTWTYANGHWTLSAAE